MSSANDTLEARISRAEFIVLMSVLMALTALATDMMLPAFGDMRSTFGLPPDSNAVAPVVTMFFLGVGLGQPLLGTLSDSLGRKRILWLGLAIYALGALGAAFAPSLGVLLAWRFLSGVGAGAVRVATLGVIRDAYAGERMAKVLSYIIAVFILVPTIAPSIGAALLVVGSWQVIFAAFVACALLAAAWTIRLPETLPRERRIALDLGELATAAKAVVTSRFAMGLTLARMAVFGFFASYLASSQVIVDDVLDRGELFPVIFAGGALVIGTGMLLNPGLLDRLGLRRLLRFTLSGYLGAALVFASVAVATGGRPPPWLYLASLFPVLLAYSFVLANMTSAAMMPMGNIAGTAAALLGTIVMLGGASLGAVIDFSFDGSVTPFALAGVVVGLAAYVLYRWADAVWEASAERELLPPDDTARASDVVA
jgi:DHA1 family bicyclomycin/chloramphenicol resistance-like MFS transporter